jgi:hypothetical protein
MIDHYVLYNSQDNLKIKTHDLDQHILSDVKNTDSLDQQAALVVEADLEADSNGAGGKKSKDE